jgi:glutaredoxin
MSKIIAYCKIGCPHSEATTNLLTEISSKYKQSVKIIKVGTDSSNIIYIGDKLFNKSKEDFFKYVAKNESVNLNDHKTFPVNIFMSSDGSKHFIGGNDKLKTIYNLAKNTSIVSISCQHQEFLSNVNELESDGQIRLYCNLLKVLNKITY